MTTKYVSDTSYGKSVNAWVILSPDHKLIGKVSVAYFDSGNSLLNVFNWGKDQEEHGFQFARNYLVGNINSLLDGMYIDGHLLSDYCAIRLTPENEFFSRDFVCPVGFELANYDPKLDGWTSCFKKAGFEYLRALGYTVIQAI